MELMIDEVKNFDMQVFLAFQRVVHNGDGQNFYKRGGQHGIKEETGNRYEGHFTKRDGNRNYVMNMIREHTEHLAFHL